MSYLVRWRNPRNGAMLKRKHLDFREAVLHRERLARQDEEVCGGVPHVQRPPMAPRLYNDAGHVWNGREFVKEVG